MEPVRSKPRTSRGRRRSWARRRLRCWRNHCAADHGLMGMTTICGPLPRVGRLMTESFGQKGSPSEVWRRLRRRCWSPQKPQRKARERLEEKISEWKDPQWPPLQAQAQEEKRSIVFVEESGLTQKPAAQRTWALRGETPVLALHFHWKKLSVLGGSTRKKPLFPTA